MVAKGPSLMARGPTKMVASFFDSEALSGLLSSRLRFPVFRRAKGQAIHLTGGVFTPNVAAQLPAPPAINLGGVETTRVFYIRLTRLWVHCHRSHRSTDWEFR